MITSTRSTPVQIFISFRSAGASPQIGEILRFCDFFPSWLVILYFFSGTHWGRTRGYIFTVYGSYDVFSPKNGPFGGCDNIGIHLGVISPKNSPKRGVNRQFQAKAAEYKKRDILQSINTINMQFRRMLGPSNTSRGWSDMTLNQIQDGERHFKNRKYAITRPRIIRSSPNFAHGRTSRRKFEFLTNIAKILKFKMADGRHFENRE